MPGKNRALRGKTRCVGVHQVQQAILGAAGEVSSAPGAVGSAPGAVGSAPGAVGSAPEALAICSGVVRKLQEQPTPTMSTLIDYEELNQQLQTFFEQYASFEPEQASARTYGLLERSRAALAQYAQDLEAAYAQGEEARHAFERDLAAAQQAQ
ncbi:hypothetical protein DFP73DRAFT_598915 [Morchella snyderi]|nr:hypothetical protein DFP73DRAFT_598915 [Morchella snyderi]